MKLKTGWIISLLLVCFTLSGQGDLEHDLDENYKVVFVKDGDWNIDIEYSYLELYKRGELCFRSNDSYEFYRDTSNIRYVQQGGDDYFFFRYKEQPDPDYQLVVVLNQQKASKDTVVFFGNEVDFQDVDDDGFIEFGGLPTSWTGYCISCDSTYYLSHFVFEINNGVQFDSIVSKELNEKKYHEHLDFSRGRYVVRKK